MTSRHIDTALSVGDNGFYAMSSRTSYHVSLILAAMANPSASGQENLISAARDGVQRPRDRPDDALSGRTGG